MMDMIQITLQPDIFLHHCVHACAESRTTITGPMSSSMVNLPNLVVNHDGYDSEDHEICKAL